VATTGGLTLTTTMRVVHRVHGDTADVGALSDRGIATYPDFDLEKVLAYNPLIKR
jgi:hypothetical protein